MSEFTDKKLRLEYMTTANSDSYVAWLEAIVTELRESLAGIDEMNAAIVAQYERALGHRQFALWGAEDRAEEAERQNVQLRSQIAALEALANRGSGAQHGEALSDLDQFNAEDAEYTAPGMPAPVMFDAAPDCSDIPLAEYAALDAEHEAGLAARNDERDAGRGL